MVKKIEWYSYSVRESEWDDRKREGRFAVRKSTMTLQECYQKMGGDYTDAKRRLIKEERIEKYVIRFLKDDSFQRLCDARAARNDEEVFRAVHTLKGVSQNLGFARLYEACYSMTEAVRGGVKLENETLFDTVAKEYQATVDCIKMYCE